MKTREAKKAIAGFDITLKFLELLFGGAGEDHARAHQS
jgi:hypothetical protein